MYVRCLLQYVVRKRWIMHWKERLPSRALILARLCRLHPAAGSLANFLFSSGTMAFENIFLLSRVITTLRNQNQCRTVVPGLFQFHCWNNRSFSEVRWSFATKFNTVRRVSGFQVWAQNGEANITFILARCSWPPFLLTLETCLAPWPRSSVPTVIFHDQIFLSHATTLETRTSFYELFPLPADAGKQPKTTQKNSCPAWQCFQCTDVLCQCTGMIVR